MAPKKKFRPLDPSDFSFHGFDDLMGDVARTLRAVGIRGGAPASSVVEDAIFIPGMKVSAAERTPGRFVLEAGIVTDSGQPIELAQSRRLSGRWGTRVLGRIAQPTAVEPEQTIEEETIYLGWFFGHFGHFLTESLARTWILQDVDPSLKVVFHLKGPAPSGVTARILEAFGLPSNRLLFPKEPTRFRRLIIPEPLLELSYGVHERLPEAFRQVASTIVGDERPSQQPLYLSRRLLTGSRRHIVGEHELEEILRENGFLIAHPETMAFEDQVRLVNRHTDIFTSAGSASYNALFALKNPQVHFLTRGIPRADYFLIPAVIGASAAYCNCLGEGARPALNKTPLMADVSTFIDYLDCRGFLKNRLRASLVRRNLRLQDEFNEGWLYASVRDVPRGETLSADIESEALTRARSSWPLTWLLVRYYHQRGGQRLDELVRQFVDLVSTETNIGRLALYYDDVESAARGIAKSCDAEVAARLREVLANRFLLDVTRRSR